MGTRGFVGYQENGEIKGWYNHFDSYYSKLGRQVLERFETLAMDQLKVFFKSKIRIAEEYGLEPASSGSRSTSNNITPMRITGSFSFKIGRR